MKAQHQMPLGATAGADGVEFTLWAPMASAVDLNLEDAAGNVTETLPMQAGADHRFRWHVPGCRGGQRYRFRTTVEGRAGIVPDPASRYNPLGVDGPSEVVEPLAFHWDDGWYGRPWHEAVIYELHVGSFTEAGTYAAAQARLPYLAELGITAVELMPLAQFAGNRGWGYDGVLQFAPHPAYGTPDELKHFIQAAHRLGLMVMLDVVYNHFGPAGNHLWTYAAPFFNPRHETPWGAAVGFDGDAAPVVRDFYTDNALYWLQEFRFDGLRFDAVHAIRDESAQHILRELPQRLRAALDPARHVHLVLENEENQARWLDPAVRDGRQPVTAPRFDAQWNDDFHHAAHVALTGEASGYYADYAGRAVARLGRALAEGFIYQGDASPHREGRPRGEPSRHLPATAFVNFLQNHDQIGNRPYGDRLTALASAPALEAMTALWLLSPPVPLLFMGEEWGATTPFRYFCDFSGELGNAVTRGRRREIAGLLGLADADMADPPIPDPCAESSLAESRLDWSALEQPDARERQALYRTLLRLRRDRLVPLIPQFVPGAAQLTMFGERALQVVWPAADGSAWVVQANLGDAPATLPPLAEGSVDVLHRQGEVDGAAFGGWSVRVAWAANAAVPA